MKALGEMSDEELKSRYISLWESVFVVECFGSKDLIELEAIAQELERRGYEVTESRKPRIRRIR
jgi:hypothetical protein